MHLLHKVLLDFAWTEDAQDLLRIDGADNQLLADDDMVTFTHDEALALRDWVSNLFGAIIWNDDDLAELVGIFDLDTTGGL